MNGFTLTSTSKHITQRFWWCLLLGISGLVLVAAAQSVLWAALGAPYLLVLALSLIDGWWPKATLDDVSLDRTQVVENDLVVTTVSVSANRSLGWVETEVEFPSTLQPQASARFLTGLKPGAQRNWTIPANAVRWGLSGPQQVTLITQDRLGITQRIEHYDIITRVRVFPALEKLKAIVPLWKERQVTGEHRSKAAGSGSELAHARPYRYGDPVRMIHPRLSARRGENIVLERHPERSSTLVLLIDTAQDVGIGLETTLRWTVTASLAFSQRHLQAQDKIGLIDVGLSLRWVPPGLGRRHQYAVVDTVLASQAAAIGPHQIKPFVSPPDLPRSSTIIAISPLVSNQTLLALQALRAQGHHIVVLKPGLPTAPPNISPLAQRIFRIGNQLNERWLTERGSIVIPWQPGSTLEQMLRQVSQRLGSARIGAPP